MPTKIGDWLRVQGCSGQDVGKVCRLGVSTVTICNAQGAITVTVDKVIERINDPIALWNSIHGGPVPDWLKENL